MTYRVMQWYTGDIAKRQMRYVHARPDMALVGGVVHFPEKAGLDLGEIAGLGPLGVLTTADEEAALATPADCVLFNPPIWKPELAARILRSGKNLITIRGAWYPRHEPEYEMLQTACRDGNSSIMGTGNMPGLINDAIPLFMAGYTRNVRRISTYQSSSPVMYTTRGTIDQLGLGRPPGDMADPNKAPTVPVYHAYMRQASHLLAESFGLRLSSFELTDWKLGLAPEDVYLEAKDFTIKKGGLAGFEIEFTGYVDGRPWHVHRVQHTWCFGIGEGWRERTDEPEWRVEVEGDPSLRMQLETYDGPDPFKSHNLLDLNAARVVNLIPAVCAAPPGCRTAFECGLVTETGLVTSD